MFAHYRELVRSDQAQEWFNIFPGADYPRCLLARCSRKGPQASKGSSAGLIVSARLSPLAGAIRMYAAVQFERAA
jgi:hypothetical protein